MDVGSGDDGNGGNTGTRDEDEDEDWRQREEQEERRNVSVWEGNWGKGEKVADSSKGWGGGRPVFPRHSSSVASLPLLFGDRSSL